MASEGDRQPAGEPARLTLPGSCGPPVPAAADATSVGGTGLADIPMQDFAFTLGEQNWMIRAASDHAALLGVADRFEEFPFGLLLWESASVLAAALAERAGEVAGRRVLELGCGAGFGGIVAKALGAARVRQTDHIAEALELASLNAALNGVAGVEVACADWSRWDDAAIYDLIIGSDVLYNRAAHAAFAAILALNLAPNGRVLLADPLRQDTPLFLADMRAAGWTVTTTRTMTPALLPGGADIVPVDLIALCRPCAGSNEAAEQR